jgi:dTDP-4-dehydrorhamnose reductase
MLGHKVAQLLSSRHQVSATLREAEPPIALRMLIPAVRFHGGISAEDTAGIAALLRAERPAAVVNCVGIIKQLRAAKDAVASITVNALFPHQLATLCGEIGARLVHFGTDCVFSGARGPYGPADLADAQDLYGRTKLLGEVGGAGCLTLRSSIIGHELKGRVSLIDWFLSNHGGQVRGFAHALYTGIPTLVMAQLVERAVSEWRDLDGVWQVAADPISKYDLLQLVNHVYGLGIAIEREETFRCDRRLDGSAFRERTGWQAPPWPAMVAAMYADFVACGAAYGARNG